MYSCIGSPKSSSFSPLQLIIPFFGFQPLLNWEYCTAQQNIDCEIYLIKLPEQYDETWNSSYQLEPNQLEVRTTKDSIQLIELNTKIMLDRSFCWVQPLPFRSRFKLENYRCMKFKLTILSQPNVDETRLGTRQDLRMSYTFLQVTQHMNASSAHASINDKENDRNIWKCKHRCVKHWERKRKDKRKDDIGGRKFGYTSSQA